jgi:hypothetical protein
MASSSGSRDPAEVAPADVGDGQMGLAEAAKVLTALPRELRTNTEEYRRVLRALASVAKLTDSPVGRKLAARGLDRRLSVPQFVAAAARMQNHAAAGRFRPGRAPRPAANQHRSGSRRGRSPPDEDDPDPEPATGGNRALAAPRRGRPDGRWRR